MKNKTWGNAFVNWPGGGFRVVASGLTFQDALAQAKRRNDLFSVLNAGQTPLGFYLVGPDKRLKNTESRYDEGAGSHEFDR